jgi:hypothetical protein
MIINHKMITNLKSKLLSKKNIQKPERHRIEPKFKTLIGTHHKTGTNWMENIFRKLSNDFNLKFFSMEQVQLPSDFEKISYNYRGIHLIRDPRDVIISGCFYHQKSKESWLHIVHSKFGGLTYQQMINSYTSISDQIMFEMNNAGSYNVREILAWNYNNPNFMEIKYEDLISDFDLFLFHKIFVFLGYPNFSIPQALEIAYNNSLFSGKVGQSSHIRSGKTSQWQEYFTPAHKARFLELFGDALITLGYEKNHDWATN